MKKAKQCITFLLVPVIEMLLISCAGTPHANPVQETEQAYQIVEKDTLVVNNAPDELAEAKQSVDNLKKTSLKGQRKDSLNQQLMLARQRIKIAQKTAELRATRNKAEHITSELRMLQNDVHKIERQRMEAGLSKMEIDKRIRYLNYFTVRKTPRGWLLKFKNLEFNQEKASLKSSAEPPIHELADFLDAYPQRTILIEGFTDNTGSKSFNKKLSQQRANTVREALISSGITGSRIKAVGLGEQYPRVSNKTKAGREYNRRVEVVLSDKSGEIPDRGQ